MKLQKEFEEQTSIEAWDETAKRYNNYYIIWLETLAEHKNGLFVRSMRVLDKQQEEWKKTITAFRFYKSLAIIFLVYALIDIIGHIYFR